MDEENEDTFLFVDVSPPVNFLYVLQGLNFMERLLSGHFVLIHGQVWHFFFIAGTDKD